MHIYSLSKLDATTHTRQSLTCDWCNLFLFCNNPNPLYRCWPTSFSLALIPTHIYHLHRKREREMALEAVNIVEQDPFIYSFGAAPCEEEKPNPQNLDGYWDSWPESGKCRRKRRRVRPTKNKEQMENQRMTHIAVERNRRRQMNDYLAVLRSIMPPSYAQRVCHIILCTLHKHSHLSL